MEAPATTLLSAARAFIRRPVRAAALAIVPLAAVSLTPKAHAQVTIGFPAFNGSVSGSVNASFSNFHASGGSLQTLSGATRNNLTSLTISSSGTITSFGAASGGAVNTLVFSGTTAGSGSVTAGTVVPIGYSFTLDKSGLANNPNVAWTLKIRLDASNGFVNVATGTLFSADPSGTTFANTVNYTATNGVSTGAVYDALLELNYFTFDGDVLGVTMSQGSQGITFNAAPIPEPSAYAALLGLATGGLALFRHRRRPAGRG